MAKIYVLGKMLSSTTNNSIYFTYTLHGDKCRKAVVLSIRKNEDNPGISIT